MCTVGPKDTSTPAIQHKDLLNSASGSGSKPKLPSFWVPALTPDAKPTEIKKPVSCLLIAVPCMCNEAVLYMCKYSTYTMEMQHITYYITLTRYHRINMKSNCIDILCIDISRLVLLADNQIIAHCSHM